jgi:hypothetical protein
MKDIRGIIICLMVSGAASVCSADRYVAQNGQTPAPTYTTWTGAASNIQEAVDAAGSNDTVWVGPGVYTAPPNPTNYAGFNVVYINKPLSLRGSSGSATNTIIDGGGAYRGIAIYYSSAATTNRFLVDGFTISNCVATNIGGGILIDPVQTKWTGTVQNCFISDNTVRWGVWGIVTNSRGGGIGCDNGTSGGGLGLFISNCVIRANRALSQGAGTTNAGRGGGLWIRPGNTGAGKQVVLTSCVIESNSATAGGGAWISYGPRMFDGCVFRANRAINDCGAISAPDNSGGGVFLEGSGERATFRNCVLQRNETVLQGAGNSGNGSAIYSYRGVVMLENCTIASNTAAAAYAVYIASVVTYGAGLGVRNSIISANSAYNWTVDGLSTTVGAGFTNYCYNSCLSPTNTALGYLPGSGNTAMPPAFMDFSGGDLRLKNYSCGVDAGITQTWMSATTDLAGQPRVSSNGLVDMGAYETNYQPHADYYAAQNGQTPMPPYTNWSMAASNIQDAVNQLDDTNYPATVWVGAGRYTVPPNAVDYKGTNVVYINKPVTLRSSNSVPESTIIDGGGAYRGIAVDYNYDTFNRFVIDGFTISNGYVAISATNGGAGILFNSGTYTAVVQNCLICNNTVTSTPATLRTDGGGGLFIQSRPAFSPVYYVISNCTFRGNRVLFNNQTGGGGGAYLITSRGGRIDNCLIENNSVTDGAGGGLLYFGASPFIPHEIRNSVIRNNTQNSPGNAELGGGGIEFTYQSAVRMWNCLVYNNWSGVQGGGIFNMKGGYPLELYNCTVVSNRAPAGSSAGGFQGRMAGDTIKMVNSIVCSNVSGAYPDIYIPVNNLSSFTNCCITSTNYAGTNIVGMGTGNITNSPKFVNFPAQDFHLSSGSPCINTGTNLAWMDGAVDLDGNARISPKSGGTVDMGAYEFPYHFGSIFTVR